MESVGSETRNMESNKFKHNDRAREGELLQTVAVLSTLLTALEVRYRTSERQAGRDPSNQEAPSIAKSYLSEAIAEFEDILMQLSASTVYSASYDEDYLAAAVRRFDDLMMLNRTGVLLQSIHQRLLSLYPDVRESMVEEARLLQGVHRELVETDEEVYPDGLARFVERGLALALSINRELLETS